MKHRWLSHLTVLMVTFFPSLAILSEPSSITIQPTEECAKGISFVLEDIKKHGIETPMLYSYTNNANDGYYGNPTNRTEDMAIVLAGDDNQISDVMSSGSLMTYWANHIASSCLDVASVRYGVWQTGWSINFAIQEDGKMQGRRCIDSNIVRALDKIHWNTTGYCDI